MEPKDARTGKDTTVTKKLKDSKDPVDPEESSVMRPNPVPMRPHKPVSSTLANDSPKQANHAKPSQIRETPKAMSSGGATQGRMADGNELSSSSSTSTTRSGGYRNAYYNYNSNGGNNNPYYNYGQNGGNNKPLPVEEEIFVPQSRAETPEKVSMVLEAFQDSRMLADPVLADVSYLAPGTQYLFSNEPLYNVVFDVPPNAEDSHRPAYLVNERDKIAEVSGECIRTDPKINYTGKAYCQFEYRFLDSKGDVEASITASGPISKGDIDTLSITGGSGIFRRTVGTVILETGGIRRGSPPMFVPDDTLDLPSSYLVKMFVFLDSVDVERARSSI